MLNGSQEHRGRYGVVADYRQAVLVRNLADFAEIRHIVFGIANAFEVDAACVFIHQLFDLLGVVRVKEASFDVEFLEGLGKQCPGSAIKAG